eukprot:gene47840-58612_t
MTRTQEIRPDIDDGIDRKVLAQLRARFLKVNSGRLERAMQGLSTRQQLVLRLLPLCRAPSAPTAAPIAARKVHTAARHPAASPGGITYFAPLSQDVLALPYGDAKRIEQRFPKPQATGSNPV